MSTYIKLFETTAQYTEYMGGKPYLPNVSLCEDNLDKPIHYTALVPVSSVTLDKTSVQINKSTTLTATILPLDASNKNVTWTSSDTSKVIITGSGSTVTLNCAGVGSSTITCTSVSDPSISATCSVTVTPITATGISLDEDLIDLETNSTTTLNATVYPFNATNKDVTWSSDYEYAVKISGSGSTVTLNAGKYDSDYPVTITCTLVSDPSIKATCIVHVVKVPVEEITMRDPWTIINVGSMATVYADISPTNATYKDISWRSENEDIATVENSGDGVSGLIKGVKKGTATITAYSMDDTSIYNSMTVYVE